MQMLQKTYLKEHFEKKSSCTFHVPSEIFIEANRERGAGEIIVATGVAKCLWFGLAS